LPAWMTEPAASRFTIGDEPHFPLHILRAMRAECPASAPLRQGGVFT
jgi:hypothetical protein